MSVAVSANHWVAVTPSDSQDLPDFAGSSRLTAELWIGGNGGVIAIVERDNSPAVNVPVQAGMSIRAAVRRVNFTNTTATGITAAYVI